MTPRQFVKELPYNTIMGTVKCRRDAILGMRGVKTEFAKYLPALSPQLPS
jgi:hypothetical protein